MIKMPSVLGLTHEFGYDSIETVNLVCHRMYRCARKVNILVVYGLTLDTIPRAFIVQFQHPEEFGLIYQAEASLPWLPWSLRDFREHGVCLGHSLHCTRVVHQSMAKCKF